METEEETPTLNCVQGTLLVLRVQVPHRLAHHQSQFHLIVQVRALGPQDGTAIRKENRGGGLEEEKGLLGLGVVQLGDVVPFMVIPSVSLLLYLRENLPDTTYA